MGRTAPSRRAGFQIIIYFSPMQKEILTKQYQYINCSIFCFVNEISCRIFTNITELFLGLSLSEIEAINARLCSGVRVLNSPFSIVFPMVLAFYCTFYTLHCVLSHQRLCDWPLQRDVGLHISKSSGFNFLPRSHCIFSGIACGPRYRRTHSTRIRMNQRTRRASQSG